MAATQTSDIRRVHTTEVSTDADAVRGYGETIALVLAVVATLAAVWMAAAPSETADLIKPSIAPDRGTQLRAADDLTGATVLVQPDPDGASSTEATFAP